MEITRNNFRQQLSRLQQVIGDAQFFAIDTEFTGLNCNDATTPFDTPAEYYTKVQENTKGFIIVQFGITAFFVVKDDTGDGDTGAPRFRYESFNFYISPRSRKQTFRCQGESMAFLGSHNFDFNKLFREGLSYCDMPEANELRQKMSERCGTGAGAAFANDTVLLVPKEELELMENIRQSVREFLRSDEKEITVEHCSAFRRKLVYQMLEQEFAQEVFVTSRQLPNSSIKVIDIQRKKSNAEEKQYYVDKMQQERDEMEDYIGFTSILKLLSESKKLIVGHNMFLDVLYTMRQFVGPAAASLSDFKRVTHKMFPALLDTKYLCAQDTMRRKIPSSALGDIFKSVSKPPFVLPEIQPVAGGHSYSNVDGQIHDAGYDSYMTGFSFIAMALHLNIAPTELHTNSHKLKNLVNKLYILRLADICYIDLTGKEPQPNRDHVFYVTVPDHWKHTNIVQQFRNYGNVLSAWMSPNIAYVALQQREHASVVLPTIRLMDGVTIMTFADYQARRLLGPPMVSTTTAAGTASSKLTSAAECCRTSTKRRNNTGKTTAAAAAAGDAGPRTTTDSADGADVADGLGAVKVADSNQSESKLTKKPKLKGRTIEQTVFQVNDNWD